MNAEIVRSKKALRREMRELKKELTADQRKVKSETVMKELESHPGFQDAETVFIFWSMDDEIDTRDFILKWADRKRFILPAINGDELYLKEFSGVQKLVTGDIYAIPEPEGKPFTDFDRIELAVIPGVAFDRQNNRMGRGKAYYDKILHRLKGKALLIGICYDFQMVNEVPVEPHDVKMDGVICD
ncbi:MAG: 5-formyltetrahydrofolate cyclo-ligase [Candidatus Delongbacteria bacterium]|nr:5-formyltetrahydrofolate cyclo-ligase [Candidatus Delongbacteria bacterium]